MINRSPLRDLIFRVIVTDRNYDRAAALIESAREGWPENKMHDLLSLEAILRSRQGELQEAIVLMRRAVDQAPTFLPHLFYLADYLLEAGQWAEAERVADELIRLSEEMNEHFFLDEARLMKMICLRELKRYAEIRAVKAKIRHRGKFIRREGIYYLNDF
jgi:tetratricopeptide (TPR) repeat protein